MRLCRFKLPVPGLRLSSSKSQGLTLVELLVTLVVLSILAMAALPYAQVSMTRYKELELRRALRDVRTALDLFHEDWRGGRIGTTDPAVSEYGYPRSLEILVEGVELTTAENEIRRYLRRIPRDPFADQTLEPMEQWIIRSYTDAVDSSSSDGRDVYDVRTATDKTALDGSQYSGW
jgi:general secretion pathway protein G